MVLVKMCCLYTEAPVIDRSSWVFMRMQAAVGRLGVQQPSKGPAWYPITACICLKYAHRAFIVGCVALGPLTPHLNASAVGRFLCSCGSLVSEARKGDRIAFDTPWAIHTGFQHVVHTTAAWLVGQARPTMAWCQQRCMWHVAACVPL